MNSSKIIVGLIVFNTFLAAAMLFMFAKLNKLSKIVNQPPNIAAIQTKPETSSTMTLDADTTDTNAIDTPKSDLININSDGFIPKGMQIYSGQKMELAIINDDKYTHSFNIDELGIKTGPIEPGKTLAVTIGNLPSNSIAYEFYSDISNDKENDKFRGTIMILKK